MFFGLSGQDQSLLSMLFSYRPTERAGLTTGHLTGIADPSQEYNLRDLSSSKDERIRQTLNREDACSLNLHSLQYLCKPGVDPSSMSSSSCLFPSRVTSGGCQFSLGLTR